MERLKDGAFARALRARREHFNALFDAAFHADPTLDPEHFSRHLCLTLHNVAESAISADPGRADELVEALYIFSLELFGKKLLGPESHHPVVTALWERLFPRIGRLIAAAPQTVVASLCNAATRISSESTAVAARWLTELEATSDLCTAPTELLDSGLVLAWRLGLAHYRESAIELWRKLPEKLKLPLLGMKDDTPAFKTGDLEAGLSDPWFCLAASSASKQRELRIAGVVGGFRGFGGQFIEPPLVAKEEGTLIAFDGQGCWSIHADIYGMTLKRMGNCRGRMEGSNSQFTIDASGKVRYGEQYARFPDLANASSSASTAYTLAATLPHSHHIYIVAALPEE
jgi:hypothetical protein